MFSQAQYKTNALSDPIDVFSQWIDHAEELNKSATAAAGIEGEAGAGAGAKSKAKSKSCTVCSRLARVSKAMCFMLLLLSEPFSISFLCPPPLWRPALRADDEDEEEEEAAVAQDEEEED
jgi:hypothetical protein